MNIIKFIKGVGVKLSSSLKRFPLALLYAAFTVGLLIYMNHLNYGIDSREIYARIAMVLAIGVPMSLSIYVFFESKPDIKKSFRILAHIGVGILLVAFYFLLLKNLEYVSVTRYVAYTIALYLIFSFIPYIRRKENYELYVIRLFSRFVVTYVYSIVLYAGLSAILATINLLFNAGIPGRVFADIALIVAGIFAPAFFLADVPKRGEEISVTDYPGVIRVLLQFIVLPLLTVYTIILYIYFGKIIIIRELPQGIIGNLVLWYSIVSTIVLFFIYPVRKSNQWIKTFIMIFPKTIIPLLGMMFVAMGIRINAYGITENRYFVLIVGIWITGIMIYYSIKKDIRNIVLTITLSLIAILSVSGPWSAYSISKWSQNGRFEEVLNKYDMIGENDELKSPPTDKDFSEGDQGKISSIIAYFDNYHNLEDVKYLPEDFEIEDMKDLFGFDMKYDYVRNTGGLEYFGYNLDTFNSLVEIKDYDYFKEVDTYPGYNRKEEIGDYTIDFNIIDKEIVIKEKDNTIYSKDIEEIVEKIHKNNNQRDPSTEEMTFVDENENVKIKIIFRHINGHKNRSTGKVTVENLEFYSFIKFKK